MNLVAVAIVLAIVLDHQKSRLLIGLNRIPFCFNNNSQITKNSVAESAWAEYTFDVSVLL